MAVLLFDGSSNTWSDSLGFPIAPHALPAMQEWGKSYEASVKIQERRWQDFMAKHGITEENCKSIPDMPKAVRKQVKSLARVGVPSHQRSWLWKLCVSPRIRQRAGERHTCAAKNLIFFPQGVCRMKSSRFDTKEGRLLGLFNLTRTCVAHSLIIHCFFSRRVAFRCTS